MNTLKPLSIACGLALGLAAGGCANEPTLTERNFGESVRQMIRAQTLDPSPPSPDAIDRTDGPLLDNALESYRDDVGNRDAVDREIGVGVGGGP